MNTTLNVPTISCDHCKDTIEGAVGKLEGIETVQVDVEQRIVAVAFDDTAISLPQIVSALDEAGYEVAS
ncbi:MAG TPA: heavy-metal-associated domain-containing protein [Acidimicrobiia bacterium]|nr:heavy-metal-associated domain-containing protein [Acidimicrobiia bacterium]